MLQGAGTYNGQVLSRSRHNPELGRLAGG